MSLPNQVVHCLLYHYGVSDAVRGGLRLVSRQWNQVLRAHTDWESVCRELGIGNISRPDGEAIDWGGHFLSYAESRHTRSRLMAAVLRRKNVFLTGEGGTGKTMQIKLLDEQLTALGNKVCVVATTGMAATLIGGTTIHRWAGVGLAKEEVSELVRRLNKDARARWRDTNVLIIDEVSMLDPVFLVKLDAIGKRVRRNHMTFFGGMQVIVSGDFAQLGVVKPQGAYDYVFQHPLFESGFDKSFVFKHVYRTTDALFTDILSRVRMGDHTAEDVMILKTRTHAPLPEAEALGILPTQLYSLRGDVLAYNNQKLKELEGESVTHTAAVTVRRRDTDHSANGRYALKYERAQRAVETSCPVAREMHYKNGAQVMLVVNSRPDEGLVNGARGVITNMETDGGIEVLFMSGHTHKIVPFNWEHMDVRGDHGEAISLTFKQTPLVLAWAITTHKSQGSTLDCATMDLGSRVFGAGMSYVALSRVRSLHTFSLSSFDPTCIRADPSVRSFYAYLERFGTHRGFHASVNRMPFPTVRELRGLVQQLPAITRRRKRRAEEEAEREDGGEMKRVRREEV